jgi:hypothetical protein
MSLETRATQSAEHNIDVVAHALAFAPTDQDACPICFEPWNTNIGYQFGSILQTQCEHVFHRACLVAWFDKQNVEAEENTCPCCRTVCTPPRLRQPAYRQQRLFQRNQNTEDAPAPQISSANGTAMRLANLGEEMRRELEAQNTCTMGASHVVHPNDFIRIRQARLDRIR